MENLHLSFFDGEARREDFFQRIPELSVFGQPIVQMGPGGKTGRSDISDGLFLSHPCPLSDPRAKTGKMTIIGGIPVHMAQDHLIPESTAPSARGNGSV